MPSILVAAVVVLVGSLLTVVAVVVVARAVRWAWRLWAGVAHRYGTGPGEQMAGLLIGALFFSSTLEMVIGSLVSFVLQLCQAIPFQVNAVVRVCNAGAYASPECLASVSTNVVPAVGKALAEAASGSRLDRLPYGSLLVFVALWAAAGAGIRALRSADARPEGRAEIPAPASRRSAALMLFVAFGAYLVIGAVVALPVMEPSIADVAEASDFEHRAAEAVPVDYARDYPTQLLPDIAPAIKTQPPTPSPGAAAAAARTLGDAGEPEGGSDRRDGGAEHRDGGGDRARESTDVAAPPPAPPAAQTDGAPESGAPLDSDAALQSIRMNFQARWSGMLDWARDQERDTRRTLLGNVQVADQSLKSKRARLWYHAQVLSQAGQRIGQLDEAIHECRDTLMQAAMTLERGRRNLFSPYASESLSQIANTTCSQPAMLVELSPPPPSDDLGFFSYFAGWLVQTDSPSLALIAGLLGCGFLGSVVSTLLRRRVLGLRQEAAYEESLLYDLMSVIVRGVSAAFVVFLAARGGLAVVTGGSGQPSPYVLLFACLLAAVFSERVWTWAEDAFARLLASSGKSNQEGEGGSSDKPKGRSG